MRKDLKLDPAIVGDDDLKTILTGLAAIVEGTGSLRTHKGSAHGRGKTTYKLKPRHARLAAQELRHLWQAARWRDDRKSANLPMYHGSRGKFSEVDTEGFAITMLREWRRRNAVQEM